MRPFSLSGLRTRLGMIVLIAVVPAFLFIVYIQSTDRRRAREQTAEGNFRLAQFAANEEGSVLIGAARLLQTIADFPALFDDLDACNALFPKIVRNHAGYNGMVLADGTGRLVCSSTPGDIGDMILDRPWFGRALQARTAVTGEYQVSRSNGEPDIVVAQAFRRVPADAVWVLAVGLQLTRLSRMVSTLRLPSGARLTLFDRNRTILARYPDPGGSAGTRLPASFSVPHLPANEPGLTAQTLDGVPRLFVTVPVEAGPDTGLYVTLDIERAAAFAASDRLLRQHLWLLGFVVLSVMGAALIGAEAFVLRPVTALQHVTDRLAGGDLSARAALAGGLPGLSGLGEAINTMATSLETRERERDRAEEQLRASEERYRVPFDQTPHPSWLYDVETLRFIEVNRMACDHYGYTRDEFLRMTVPDIQPAERAEAVVHPALPEPSVPDPRPTSIHRKKDGTFITVEISAMTVSIRGRPAVIVLAHDVSERSQLEQQLRQAQKMEAVGRLAGGIAHDFNNLLTVILGFSELVLAHPDLPEAAGRDIDEIRKAGQSAASLTRQLLAFGRKQVLQPQVLDLRRTIGEDVQLVTRLAPALGRVSADPGQIEQVIMNMAVNARDAMRNGGVLTIETENVPVDAAHDHPQQGAFAEAYIRLAVRDTGTGMDAMVQAHVFEPFFTTKELGKGTGLGLATVYGIVTQSGGSVSVESELGRGTTFEVLLPRSFQPTERRAPAPPRLAWPGGTETILLVEDQDEVRAVTRAVLSRHGYTVLEASGGEGALQIALDHDVSIDLLLTDVIMPGMSGGDLARRILADRPRLGVLFASGYTDDAIMHHGVLDSGVFFIQKPFTPESLLRKAREVLDASRETRQVAGFFSSNT
jgi:two-component system cell cycle sensor histidine kinase/response regulator CckA